MEMGRRGGQRQTAAKNRGTSERASERARAHERGWMRATPSKPDAVRSFTLILLAFEQTDPEHSANMGARRAHTTHKSTSNSAALRTLRITMLNVHEHHVTTHFFIKSQSAPGICLLSTASREVHLLVEVALVVVERGDEPLLFLSCCSGHATVTACVRLTKRSALNANSCVITVRRVRVPRTDVIAVLRVAGRRPQATHNRYVR